MKQVETNFKRFKYLGLAFTNDGRQDKTGYPNKKSKASAIMQALD